MSRPRTLFALGALSALVIACSESSVAPTASDSGALSLAAPLLVSANYGLSLQALDVGIHSQEDVIVARDGGSGVQAVGSWRTEIHLSGGNNLDARGSISCVGFVDGGGARLGGVVTQSSDPSLVGATMVASVKDAADDWSTGIRIHAAGSGIVAQEHCSNGYPAPQIGIDGKSTFKKINVGFVYVNGVF